MRFAVKHMVWLTLLLYLLSGFGSAFGAFWCVAEETGCGLGNASARCCASSENAATTAVPADHLLDASRCGLCLDIDLWFPTLKTRAPSVRIPFVQPPFLPAISPAVAALTLVSTSFSPGLDVPGPLLAQRHLRTVVLLN